MASIDGFYSCYMTGAEGNGFAMFVFQAGVISGADPLGVLFDGTYVENKTDFDARINVTVPSGGTVIQGASAGPAGLTYQVTFKLKADFQEMDFFRIDTPLGAVNVRLKKLRTMTD